MKIFEKSKLMNNKNLIMWNEVDWNQTRDYLRRIQYRIYKAEQNQNHRLVIWLQKQLVQSKAAKIMAVHQVTTLNKGRKTSGVDKQTILSAREKARLAASISLNGTANPIRRVWIPKPGKTQLRPLGIPTIRDRAKQALAKFALEPQWEAKFEPNSFGFRPARRSHDAIEAIFSCLHYNRPKYVYDADIEKCFDKINHQALIEKLNTFPQMRKQVKAWLEARVMDNVKGDDEQPTINKQGTPQGGVISPLLANIALHGLEDHLKLHVAALKPPYKGGHSKRDKRRALGVIRYADDFVLIHRDKQILQSCISETERWLKSIGLEINTGKSELRDGREGLNFLGFQVIQVRKKTADRYKVKMIPSKQAQKNVLEKAKQVIQHNKAASSYFLIKKLAPIIVGWANYYKYCECSKIFGKLDHLIFQKLRAWAFRRDTKHGRRVIKEKYFPSGKTYLYDGSKHQDNWVLVGKTKGHGDKIQENYLPRMSWIHSRKFVKVKGSKSPYDNDQLYWTLRTDKYSTLSLRARRLLRAQGGKCALCHKMFDFKSSQNWEVDHIVPRKLGGKDAYANLNLVHRECHILKTTMER